MKTPLDSNSIITQKQGLVVSEIDGETVMMSVERGNYYGMDLIGSRIWEIVKEPQSLNDIVKHLTKEYNVSKDQCEKDVIEYLIKLSEENIIEITNKDS